MPDTHILKIISLGSRGDGEAFFEEKPVYVPYTAPGDEIRAMLRPLKSGAYAADNIEIVREGPSRQKSACQHFGVCGGCQLQHIDPEAYSQWVENRIQTALAHHGINNIPVLKPLFSPPGSRRRAGLKWAVEGGKAFVGFYEAGSHKLVDLKECPVLHPQIQNILPTLRDFLEVCQKGRASGTCHLTRVNDGILAELSWSVEPGPGLLMDLADFAEKADLAALYLNTGVGPELIAERRPPEIIFGKVPVSVPPGSFLQATSEGEKALQDSVLSCLAGCEAIADLFSGLGTFSFPLREASHVDVYEGDGKAFSGCQQAANKASVPLGGAQRDLFRNPLLPEELEKYDGVVIDPPRAGAPAQMRALARSRVRKVAAVSCNPNTFARDAKTLLDGGYTLEWVQPVDQFLWSRHLELVACFSRP